MRADPVTPRPTILQIIPRLDTGGAELSTLEVTAAVVRAGGRMLVATEGGRLADQVRAAGGVIITFPAATKNPVRLIANAGRLAGLIRAEGVALVHARSRAPAWSALIAARRTAKPFVTTYHGAYGGTGRLKTLYNGVMARGDVVIANSAYTRRLILDRHGTDPARIVVINRGVDLARFDPARITPERQTRLRAAWNVSEGTPIILQAARLAGWKGQSVLIEAARLLHASGRLGNAVVILAGDAQGRDGYRERLIAQIQAAGLADAVRLVGHVDDIPAAFALARVAVVASTEPEAFGRAAAEAMAMACPVIVTDHGAPPETVRAEPAVPAAETTGWLVPPGDAAALADRLATALSLPDAARSEIGQRARQRIARDYSVTNLQRQTLAVYDRLLGTDLATRFEQSGEKF